MKRTLTTLAAFCMAALVSCSGKGTGKFIGTWKALNTPVAGNVDIHKQGNTFLMTGENGDKQTLPPMTFTYDEARDVLTFEDRGEALDLRYEPKTKHLILGPRTAQGVGPQAIEFEKVK